MGQQRHAVADRGKIRVTMHHSELTNLVQRGPRVRFGRVHVYNNLYRSAAAHPGAAAAGSPPANDTAHPEGGPSKGAPIVSGRAWRAMPVRRPWRALIALAVCLGALPVIAVSHQAYAATPIHVYVAGDSTASTYPASASPRTGWGQALPVFLNSRAAVVMNVAKSGASSKSFIDLGRLDHILGLITEGDYLLISFGHNDAKSGDAARYTIPATTYKSHLSQYIDKARAKGAKPVLITPVERRRFTRAGAPSHGRYPAAMAELAAAKGVPLIDLTAASMRLWNEQGVEGTKKHFMVLPAGKYANYPGGITDNTHFQAYGAIQVARLIARSLHSRAVIPAAGFQKLDDPIPTSAIVRPAKAPY